MTRLLRLAAAGPAFGLRMITLLAGAAALQPQAKGHVAHAGTPRGARDSAHARHRTTSASLDRVEL